MNATISLSSLSARILAISRARIPLGPPPQGTRILLNSRFPQSLRMTRLQGALSISTSNVLPNPEVRPFGFPCHPIINISTFFSLTALSMPRAIFRQYHIVVVMGNLSMRDSITSIIPSLPSSINFSASLRGTASGTGTMWRSLTLAFFASLRVYVVFIIGIAFSGLATGTMI